jgi:hypothetical protein
MRHYSWRRAVALIAVLIATPALMPTALAADGTPTPPSRRHVPIAR